MYNFRTDIAGIRGLAVILVVLYHLDFNYFRSGWLGVNIFFVISAFLMIAILEHEYDNGIIKISSFYKRRIKRVVPGLLFVIALIYFPFLVLYPPALAHDFNNSVLSALTFLSNIFFWLSAGYFDTSAEVKPLLHTWSLGVEMSFYIIYPLIFMLCRKRAILPKILLITFFISFSLAILLVDYSPNATFYLFPTRGFEFAMGCLAFYVQKAAVPRKLFETIGSILGVCLIIQGLFLEYFSQSHIPWVYKSIIVDLGIFLLLVFLKPNQLLFNILSNRILLLFGLISYSIYLLHWPIIAGINFFIDEISVFLKASIFGLVFFCSMVAYKFIEVPFRKNHILLGRLHS